MHDEDPAHVLENVYCSMVAQELNVFFRLEE